MFNLFNKLKWKKFLANMEEIPEKVIFTQIVNEFFIPDSVDIRKFMANYKILSHGSRELYKSSTELLKEPDFSQDGTPTIDTFLNILDRPVGYGKWFFAGYPDVIKYFSDLEDEKITRFILSNSLEENHVDEKNMLKLEYLRKMVNEFKNKGNKLECLLK